jgi:hypothetical protein
MSRQSTLRLLSGGESQWTLCETTIERRNAHNRTLPCLVNVERLSVDVVLLSCLRTAGMLEVLLGGLLAAGVGSERHGDCVLMCRVRWRGETGEDEKEERGGGKGGFPTPSAPPALTSILRVQFLAGTIATNQLCFAKRLPLPFAKEKKRSSPLPRREVHSRSCNSTCALRTDRMADSGSLQSLFTRRGSPVRTNTSSEVR